MKALIAGLLTCLFSVAAGAAGTDYAMYVWKTGFDATVSGCDEAKLLAWDKAADPECYTHNWEIPQNRQWLWDTANRPGREIGRLFISDIKPRLEPAYLAGDCSDPDVLLIKEMLQEGHCKVPDAKLYALLSTNDVAVSEQDHVPYVVWYNDTCAVNASQRFDGVAVNNEGWNDVKCTSVVAEQDYLDNLQAIAYAADLQINGTLATHYSIGWKWSFCDSTEVTVVWDGTIQPATYHMIDVFDSVDVQVAFVNPVTVADRATTAGYAHAVTEGKPFHVLSFVNKTSSGACTTTHFPYFCASTWSNPARTDDYLMENIFDDFALNGIPDAIGGIHFFRGVYSTGAHADWPSYYSGTVSTCTLVAYPLLEFASPDNDDEISWPGLSNATMYELARADDPRFGVGCRILATTPQTSVVDQERPAPGSFFSYLVRVAAPELGDWGETSAGVPRTGSCL